MKPTRERPTLPPAFTTTVEPSDPATDAQWERGTRNAAWFDAHAAEIYRTHRDRFVCVAGEELFVGETWQAANAAAAAKYPDDNGRLIRYIPAQRLVRI